MNKSKLLSDIEAIDAQIARVKELNPNNPILTTLLTVRENKQAQIRGVDVSNTVSTPKVDTNLVSDIQTPVIVERKNPLMEVHLEVAQLASDAASKEGVFICSKGCGKLCTSKAGKVSHERACKHL